MTSMKQFGTRIRIVGGMVGIFGAAVVWMGACTPVTPLPPEEGTTDVTMDNLAFSPKIVTINVGEKVRWVNTETGFIPHTATSGDPEDADPGALWDSGTLQPGESFTRQFNEAGEFEYYCIFHYQDGSMRHARVIVVEPQP